MAIHVPHTTVIFATSLLILGVGGGIGLSNTLHCCGSVVLERAHVLRDPLQRHIEVFHAGGVGDADVLGRAEAFSRNCGHVCFVQQAMSNVSGRTKAAFAE